MADTPLSRYHKDLQNPEFEEDESQELAVRHLQRLYEELTEASLIKPSLITRLGFTRNNIKTPVQGLYFWGGVGRGKTYLVDTFYDCLPFKEKSRIHFHRFMQRIHNERKAQSDLSDPLVFIGEKLAKEARVICFDEFVVHDVADAVILARLLKVLFDNGVTLVATSNVEPKNLYKGGLQRDLFIPAIDMISKHTDIVNIDSGVDYRLLFLDKADTYFFPLDEHAEQGMMHNYTHLAPDKGKDKANIIVEGRSLTSIKRADGVIWFDFLELCDGPRSQNDYIELAMCFHSILISNIPILDKLKEDQARRFINLVDVMYDHSVKLIISAQVPVTQLYVGTKVEFEFQRTVSRLLEMQSTDYLALGHKTN